MKKFKQFIAKIFPAIVACFALVLTASANSSTCFYYHQPKVPKGLDDFKRIK